jgi:hypothetical protein
MLSFIIASALCLPSPAPWVPFATDRFQGHSEITTLENKTIHVLWTVDAQKKEIEWGVASNHGEGWLALGFSETGGMRGANTWMGHVKEGKFVVDEGFAADYGQPEKVQNQTISVVETHQKNGVTAFVFKRPLHGCDSQHHDIIVDVPIMLIYAFGTSNRLGIHERANRGQKMVDLSTTFFKNLPQINENDPENRVLTIQGPQYTIPQNESTVYCYTFYDLSEELEETQHIIQEDFVIGTPATHHMIGYLCESPPPQFTEPGTQICNYYRERPGRDEIRFNNTCFERTHLAWGMGIHKRVYPSELGKPLGAGPHRANYFLLETHYSNPDNQANMTDPGSGFKLTLTKKLRTQEVGIWTVGAALPSIRIPAGTVHTLEVECGSKCTSRNGSLPANGVTLFSTFLHMHKRGKEISTIVVRGGKELEPLPQHQFYDFNFQSFSYTTREQQKLLPGDRLITKCTWDASQDQTDIIGGHSSEQEMCFNFIEYYPAQNTLTACLAAFPQPGLMINACPLSVNDTNARIPLTPADRPSFTAFQPENMCPATNRTDSKPSSAFAPTIGWITFLWILFQ